MIAPAALLAVLALSAAAQTGAPQDNQSPAPPVLPGSKKGADPGTPHPGQGPGRNNWLPDGPGASAFETGGGQRPYMQGSDIPSMDGPSPVGGQRVGDATTPIFQPYGAPSFDELLKGDVKQLESEHQATLKTINDNYDAERKFEEQQFRDKLAQLARAKDERLAFEKENAEEWRKFMKALKEIDPMQRPLKKREFDQKNDEARQRFDEQARAKGRAFQEEQNRQRQKFWRELQARNDERRRQQTEAASRWGRSPGQR